MSSFLNKFFGNLSVEKEEKLVEITFEEDRSDEDDSPDDNNHDYLGELVYSGTPSIYIANAREFSNHTKNWAFNRDIDEKHVQHLKDELESSQTPHFVGTFKVAIDTYNNVRLMDGQHRHAALRRIITTNSKFNMKLILEVYSVSNVNDGVDTFVLFTKCNNVLNLLNEDIPKKIYAGVVSKLLTDYKQNIRQINAETGREPNYPNISDSKLYKELSKSGIVEDFSVTENELLRLIKAKNSYLSTLTLEELFPFKQTPNEKERCKNGWIKCSKNGFYLGLVVWKNKELSWIYEIYNELKASRGIKS